MLLSSSVSLVLKLGEVGSSVNKQSKFYVDSLEPPQFSTVV